MNDKTRLIKEKRTHKASKMRMLLTKRIAFMVAPLVLLTCEQATQPAQAILNCFTPNMFKFNKGGQQPLVYNAGERANWYPQAQGYQTAAYPQMAYGAQHQHPFKMLFQPKWKGASMFGGKGWNAGWKMGHPGVYRPSYGYGYGGGYGGSNLIPPATAAAGSGYIPGFSEQLQIAPFSIPAQLSSYTSPGDGWSVPFSGYPSSTSGQLQQTQLGSYGEGGYTQSPGGQLVQPGKPTTDPYGTKGASTISPAGNKLYTTTKNILWADGGYDFFDAFQSPIRNQSYGYAYPDWYSGIVDSPAKIAQQLLKHGLRKQRLQQQQQNRSAPLVVQSSGSNFAILDEPRFVGFGTVDDLSSREARLSCAFNEAIDQSNRPVWVKFQGPYNSSRIINLRVLPPFNCASSQCRTQEIESTKDFRYRLENGPATSTLIISEPRLSDYGIYRCSALTKTINNNPLETIYQIVRFGNLK